MRPENEKFAEFQNARLTQATNWPEPQTTELHRVLQRGALRILSGTCGRDDPELAGFIASHVLLKLGQFAGASEFSTWFFQVARNMALNQIRIEKRNAEVALDSVAEPIANVRHGDLGGLELALELEPGDQELLDLVLDGETFVTIAQRLGTSKSGAHRKWLKLREKLKYLLNYSERL